MATPKASSTIVLMRDNENEIEVLIMRRNKSVKFLGGFWVFPGGAVEESDVGLDDFQTAKNAAVRETEEEAGVTIDVNGLVDFDHWTTPEGVPKRFATWFFAAKSSSQEVRHDGSEMVDSLWIKPAEALEMHKRQEIDILPPTFVSLYLASQFSSVAEALDGFAQKKTRFFLPKVSFFEEQLIMLYPGDTGYDDENAANTELRHRCVRGDQGWNYINDEDGIDV